MDNARPLNHFSIELPFTRDNARGVMDLSFSLCKGRKGKKEEEEEEKGEREEGGEDKETGWIYAKCAGYILHPKKAMLPRREQIPQIASDYVSKLYFVPVSSFKHNRRGGFLEAAGYEMSRTCMPYLLYFFLTVFPR